MAFRTQKISQMTPKGANLEGTDLLEVSTIESGSYVTRSITGQEIIDAAAAAGGVTSVGATAPIASSGGTTPTISIATADTSTTGALTSTDWNTFNGKQDALTLTTTGTSGAATLVGSTLNIPQYSGGGGASGIHALVKPRSGTAVCQQIVGSGFGSTMQSANRFIVAPFIPATSFTTSNFFIRVTTGVASSLTKIIVYDDLNAVPNNLLYASTDIDCSTAGTKTATTTFNFVAGTIYWVGVFTNLNPTIFTIASAQSYSFIVTGAIPNPSNCLTTTVTYGAAPNPAPGSLGQILTNMPFVGITAV